MSEKLIEILILIALIMFFGGMFYNIFFKNHAKLNARQLDKIGVCEPKSVKRLSVYPYFIGLERFFITDVTLWFDENFIYIFNNDSLVSQYKFADVKQLKKTYLKINNIAIYKISFKNSEKIYKFARYQTLIRSNFNEFLQILNDKNYDFQS